MPVVRIEVANPATARWVIEHPDEVAAWIEAKAAEARTDDAAAAAVEDAAGWNAGLTGADAAALAVYDSADDWADDEESLRTLVHDSNRRSMQGCEWGPA